MSEFRQRKAQDRLQEAQAALARGELAVAAAGFEAALRLDPEGPGARAGWQLWADVLEREGKLVEAGRVLGEALARHGDDPQLRLSLAHVQIEIGQFAGALRLLRELREAWPEQRPPLAHLAVALRDTRELAALRALLDEALAGSFAGDEELEALRRSCEGWQGERAEERRPLESMRELLRRRHGVVLLGTGHDDGLAIPWYSTYLCSNYDVVASCARLLGFADYFGWRWSAVAAVDEPARVLAELLARALDLPVREAPGAPAASKGAAEGPATAPDPGETLAVASFLSPGWETKGAGPWARRCAEQGNLFAFGALDYTRHSVELPPILAMAAGERVCLPWWRLGEARLGFSRFGLIEELPPEIDGRPPAVIAEQFKKPLAEYELGPSFVAAARDLLEHRGELQAGLRARSDFTRILPRAEPQRGPLGPLPEALERGDMAEFLRALRALEAAPRRIGERELELLERRFEQDPDVRSRLSDLLYRVAPARFTATLEALVARPEDQVPLRERDGLLHLYGCSPWGRRNTEQLHRWLALGSMSNRSEIVQSKYGLHHLAEAGEVGFSEILGGLFADEPPVVIGTLRWLHDNPHLHQHAKLAVPLIRHAHPDVAFEAFQCTRVAGIPRTLPELAPFLRPDVEVHPRLRSAAVEHLELLDPDLCFDRLVELLADEDLDLCWAATRALIRGGELEHRLRGAQAVAARLAELGDDEAEARTRRRMLRALATAEDFEVLEVVLAACDSPSRAKVLAAALTPALLSFDDPRLLPHLRRFRDAFGLDPPPGYASFLLRHGDPELDRAAVFGAQGARDLRAGYEAKAALVVWGSAEARAELTRALDYASPFSEAAFEAWYRVGGAEDFERLDAALRGENRALAGVAWRVLVELLAGAHRAPEPWVDALRAYVSADSERAAAWAAAIEDRLRAQVPSKFVVAAVSVDFAVLARLLPDRFEALVERSLTGVPDRFCVELLEWLGVHEPEHARSWAAKLEDSPHWGVRQASRRLGYP